MGHRRKKIDLSNIKAPVSRYRRMRGADYSEAESMGALAFYLWILAILGMGMVRCGAL
ncbi:MAG: hypothetical protein AAF196_00575 [Planctomycetota bacterium]